MKPKVEFEPALMEAVVARALASDGPLPPGFDQAGFHREADPLYAARTAGEQTAKFRQLYARWFCQGEFDRPFAAALEELPELEAKLHLVTVTGAGSRADERADLAAGADGCVSVGPGKFWMGISIQPARLLNRAELARWLRHELWHVRDMLDEDFCYRRDDLAAGPGERLPQRVIQDRYALLWSLSIDARVERAGLEPLHRFDARRQRLKAAFPSFPDEALHAALDSLGVVRGLSHADLLEVAREPRKLCSGHDRAAAPLRGAPCPLCRFPTFQWADLSAPGADEVASAIRGPYPQWSVEQGLCGTCFDLFAIRADVW